jgi:hypothetical protein
MRVRRLSSSWQMAQIGSSTEIGSSAAQIGSSAALASGGAIVSNSDSFIEKKADAPKDAEAPADAPKHKKKKVRHFSPVVPVLVIQLWMLLRLPAVHPQTPHFLVHRPPPRLTLPLPLLLRRRRLTRPQILPSPRRRLHTLALLVQSFLPCVRLLSAAFLHTCTPTLSFFPCLF